jgi:hypothetical protein
MIWACFSCQNATSAEKVCKGLKYDASSLQKCITWLKKLDKGW